MQVPAATARFAAIVKAVGLPERYTLWQAPESDPRFQRAVRENRVMTVFQEPAKSKKDFGVVGWLKEKNASYLIFPKNLRDFTDKKIVGINYDLLAAPKPRGPLAKLRKTRGGFYTERRERALEPAKVKKFRVSLRATATLEMSQQVEAANQKEAREKAVQVLQGRKPDFTNAPISTRILKIEPEG